MPRSGSDRVAGGGGDDLVSYRGASGPAHLSLPYRAATGLDGIDRLSGIEAAIGSAFDDLLEDRRGDDRLSGGSGDDALSGGSGDDVILGGAGDDTCTGGESGVC
ncbi:hypothetical protein HQ535_03655 [bacterium]|nr:hypothetical protein [bacterium]